MDFLYSRSLLTNILINFYLFYDYYFISCFYLMFYSKICWYLLCISICYFRFVLSFFLANSHTISSDFSTSINKLFHIITKSSALSKFYLLTSPTYALRKFNRIFYFSSVTRLISIQVLEFST